MPSSVEEMSEKYQMVLVYEWMDKNEYFFEYKLHSGLKSFMDSIFAKLEDLIKSIKSNANPLMMVPSDEWLIKFIISLFVNNYN